MGLAVPWNAGWSSEERFEVRPCRYVSGKLALWQPFAPGIGLPIFAKPHCVRQRKSIAEMRCTVCGEKTAEADRWWFGLGEFNSDWWVTSEAPVHRTCADHALSICPHLKRLGRNPERMPGGYRVMAARIGGDQVEKDFGVRIGQREVYGALKLAWRKAPNVNGILGAMPMTTTPRTP